MMNKSLKQLILGESNIKTWEVDTSKATIEEEQWTAQGENQNFLGPDDKPEDLFGTEIIDCPIGDLENMDGIKRMADKYLGTSGMGTKSGRDTTNKIKIAMKKGIPIPPVTVKKTWSGKKFNLVSGRHRVVAALELGMTHVPALLMYWRTNENESKSLKGLLLGEGKHEQETTKISRILMKWIMETYKLGERSSLVLTPDKDDLIFSDKDKEFVYIPDLTTMISTKIFYANTGLNHFSINGSSLQLPYPLIIINISLDNKLSDPNKQSLIIPQWKEEIVSELKNVIRHELEHQDDELNKAGDYISPSKSYTKYLTSPSEIRARVSGYYKKAKMTKKSLKEVMYNALIGTAKTMRLRKHIEMFGSSQLSKEEWAEVDKAVKNEIDSILQVWINYAKERFPKAILESSLNEDELDESIIESSSLTELILHEDEEQRGLRSKIDDASWLLTNIYKKFNGKWNRPIPYNGDSTVKIYRGIPKGIKEKIFRPGDWIALRWGYAKAHGGSNNTVISKNVPAEHVIWAGTDENEWFYVPTGLNEHINESVGKEPSKEQMDATLDLIKSIIKGTEYDGITFAAGGFVRDRIMGKDSSDLDITVAKLAGGIELSEYIARKLNIYKQSKNPVLFPQFGTAKLDLSKVEHNGISLEGVDVEFVQTRHEEYEKGSRKPQTKLGSIRQDVERRDLTINALLMDLVSGEIIDLVGGKEDIEKGIIRTPLDPEIIMIEDPLRLLRAVRFAGRYNYTMPTYMKEAIIKLAPYLNSISKERIFEELYKILKGLNPEKGIEMLFNLNLIPYSLPELQSYKEQAIIGAKIGHDYISKLALMMMDNTPSDVEKMLRRLKMSNEQVILIVTFVKTLQNIMDNNSSYSILKYGHEFYKILGDEYLKYIFNVDEKAQKLEQYIKSGPVVHVSPKELMTKYGVKQGPNIGKLVNNQKELWYHNPMITREETLRRLNL